MDAGPASSPSKPNTGQAVAATLAEAGHTLEGSEADLVTVPLRLAFETKQPRIVEAALDCLHVRITSLQLVVTWQLFWFQWSLSVTSSSGELLGDLKWGALLISGCNERADQWDFMLLHRSVLPPGPMLSERAGRMSTYHLVGTICVETYIIWSSSWRSWCRWRKEWAAGNWDF